MGGVEDELRELLDRVLYFLLTLLEVLSEVGKILPVLVSTHGLHELIELLEELIVAQSSQLGLREMSRVVLAVGN